MNLTAPLSQTIQDFGEKSKEESTHSDENHEDLQNGEDITSMEVTDIITVSESDESDTEYDPNEDSDTDESSEVHWTETSSLSQECNQLMTELVEVIGKDNC